MRLKELNNMDPRLTIIDKRLKNVKRLIAISGGKGGIGKSLVASVLALELAKTKHKVGLLDLDFCSPSTHIILGIKKTYPKEERGIIPPQIYGIKFMSIIYYTRDNPSPLRGNDVSNAIIELLTITQWGNLDFLIIDLPPGISDPILDTLRLMKRTEFLLLTTQSKIVFETVKKVTKILKELRAQIIGVIENMRLTRRAIFKKEIEKLNIPYLGTINFDQKLESTIGEVDKLSKTCFAQELRTILLNYLVM